jgi:hypothetical protein
MLGNVLIKSAAVVSVCVALAVAADWHGVFSQREEHIPDVVHLTFKFVDDLSGAPIPDVHVTCVRRMSESACTERAGKNPGETTITLGVLRLVNRTLLFSHDAGFSLGSAGPVQLAFIHPNYDRLFQKLDAGDISDRRQTTRVVRLTRTAD